MTGSPGSLRVVIDARMPDGVAGGVQQWVIGLASAMSKLEGPEEYLFLVKEGKGAWLTPFLAGPCRALVQSIAPPVTPPAAAAAAIVGRFRRAARRLASWFPVLRRLRRRRGGITPARRPLSPFDRIAIEAGGDLVHFPWQSASKTTVPSIYQPWDLQHVHLPEFFSEDAQNRRDTAYRGFCAQAALVVVATMWVKSDLIAQYDIRAERIAVVNPGPVTVAYERPSAADEIAIAGALGLPERFVFYPAQAWGHKNHERLFTAMRLLRDRGVHVPLVCTGHLNERHAVLSAYIRELGLEGQVTFLGYVNPSEIQVLYGRATALIFPSLYEGWGLPIVEAFAAGLPVASSNVTSLPQLVGDAALVFDPLDPGAIADAIERLWTDEPLRGDLIERGRARVAEFDWDRTARTMRAQYRRLGGRPLEAADLALIAAEPLV